MSADTPTLLLIAALVLLVLVLAALVALWVRRPRVDLPPEWLARLQALEAGGDETRLSLARSGGAFEQLAQHLQAASTRGEAAQATLAGALDDKLRLTVAESRAGRQELQQAFEAFDLRVHSRSTQLDAAVAQNLLALEASLSQRFGDLLSGTTGQLDVSRQTLTEQLAAHTAHTRQQFGLLQEALTRQLDALVQGQRHDAEQLRQTMGERLAAMQADNGAKLEAMRATVDEKLQDTLERRLGESFKLVSDRLEQVHKGLGEMQTLAGSVGDLKRVMTNVKTRGAWGEIQLGGLIEQLFTPEQLGRNVKTVPGSAEHVEFAIRLPGGVDDQPLWLPIDAKYPVEHYQRLQDAFDTADRGLIASVANAFEQSIRAEARKIGAKYLAPPHTTDFAVMYLPTEGLFAEVTRRAGLIEALQVEHRVIVTGPANLAGMLSSLQMGFKTLAIQKRSSEVWALLAQVKTEFGKFGEVVDATRKSIEAAARKFDDVGVRTRAIERRLRDVEVLPVPADPPAEAASLSPAPPHP